MASLSKVSGDVSEEIASNKASTTGVSGVGEGFAATKLWIIVEIVDESKPCTKDSRTVVWLILRLSVVRLWVDAGGDRLAIEELGCRPPYWMGDIKV